MSAQPLLLRGADNDEGLLIAPYDGDDPPAAVTQQAAGSVDTPVPKSDDRAGAAPRITNQVTPLPAAMLRRLSLKGPETADAIQTRRDELYRNEFPVIRPRFESKCEACGSEFGGEPDRCPACGHDELRKPAPEEKREAEQLFGSVNPAGQSLRDLAKRCEPDQWTSGVSTIVVEYEYHQATTGQLYREGAIYREEPEALYRADPLALRPVLDEDGQPGGHWWVCPIHRDDVNENPGSCHCGAELQEVHFVEQGGSDGDRRYYLQQEVISWAFPHPRLHGLDGIAPSAHTWLKQATLQLMDRYGAAFYDSDADRLPNQFMILHTSNPDHWEAELAKARDEDDQYDSPIFTNEYSPQDSAQPEVEVIDAMPDELLGQNQEIKSAFKSDIRQAYGISDVHDSDLEDAGGLNNEGLQLEVVDRSLASQMNDYRRGWLDTLMKRLGFDDWEIGFLPDTGDDPEDIREQLKAAAFVKQAGGDARIEDGNLEVPDFEVKLDGSDDPPTMQGAPSLPGVGNPIPGGGGQPPGAGGSGGGGGQPAAGQQLAGQRQGVRALEQALRRLGTPDAVDLKGGVYQTRDDVPPNAQRHIKGAVRAHDFRAVESVSSRTLQNVFEATLTQPQGWSTDSIARRLQQETPLTDQRATTIAETEAPAIINRALEDASAELAREVDEQVLHYWDGPQNADTSDICAWLKGGDDLVNADVSTGFEGTHPEYGGTPVPMDELRDLQREAVELFQGDGNGAGTVRDHVLHPHERHTHRAVLEREVD